LNQRKSLFFSRVFINRQNSVETHRVESFRALKKYFLLKLKGINSFEEAQSLVGAEVQLPENELASLEEGEFYLFDLIGIRVITVAGKELGAITGIIPAAGNSLLAIKQDQKEVLIPFSEHICVEVDIPGKRIVIDPPEGLLDLNEV
jgi:16S rRNA processing protein RimM